MIPCFKIYSYKYVYINPCHSKIMKCCFYFSTKVCYFKCWRPIYRLVQCASLRWRHNDHVGVSYHQPHHCLLSRLFGRRSKKTSKLRVTGFCAGIRRGPVNSPHKWPVTRKMFPFDDVIMWCLGSTIIIVYHISVKIIITVAIPHMKQTSIFSWVQNSKSHHV